MHSQRVNDRLVSIQLKLRRNRPREATLLLSILPQPHRPVQASRNDLVRRNELGSLDRSAVTSLSHRRRCRDDLRRHIPHAKQTIIASREDSLLARMNRRRGPRGRYRRRREHIRRADPVVVLERGNVQRRNQRSDIFDLDSRFGGDSIGSQVFIDRGPEECAIDQKFERNRLVVLEEVVHQRRQSITAQSF